MAHIDKSYIYVPGLSCLSQTTLQHKLIKCVLKLIYTVERPGGQIFYKKILIGIDFIYIILANKSRIYIKDKLVNIIVTFFIKIIRDNFRFYWVDFLRRNLFSR